MRRAQSRLEVMGNFFRDLQTGQMRLFGKAKDSLIPILPAPQS
jgi:hypothetical protein